MTTTVPATPPPNDPPLTVEQAFAGQLRTWRKLFDYTLREFAELCSSNGHPEYTFEVLRKLEQGNRRVNLNDAVYLSQILGVPYMALCLPGEDRPMRLTAQQTKPASAMYRLLTNREPFMDVTRHLPYLATEPDAQLRTALDALNQFAKTTLKGENDAD